MGSQIHGFFLQGKKEIEPLIVFWDLWYITLEKIKFEKETIP